MKANSRRRVLISSVAMLLVALVALSTATFAWFTSSTSTTADGIKVRTSKTSTLKISDDTIDYTDAGFTYNGLSAIMVPASSSDGKNWFNTTAKDKTGVAVDATKFTKVDLTATNANKYVYVDQLNILNAGDVAISDIEIAINGLNNDYIRVALVPVDKKAVNGSGVTFKEDFIDNIYALDVDETCQPVNSTGNGVVTAMQPITDHTIKITDPLESKGELHYNLYVWFEGQDVDCNDNKAGTGVEGISFAVSGKPVEEVATTAEPQD